MSIASLACAAGCASIVGLNGTYDVAPEDAGSDAGASDSPTGDAADSSISSSGSCAPGGPGMTDCGGGSESCCTTLLVTGGTYYRTYANDGGGGGGGGGVTDTADPATVSDFRLDKYEVTVGRFRQFVSAWNGGSGWTPPAGSGKHTHLNGGRGLVNAGTPGTYESGWDTGHDADVSPTASHLTSMCNEGDGGTFHTWTPSPDADEQLPINCVKWYEAYAFCIWDGGFLPSEAEWEYAAAGGATQLAYPWGSPAPTPCPGNGCRAVYGCDYPDGSGTCSGVANIAPVGAAPFGAGPFGQLDLAGNMFEWTLDGSSAYVNPCTDCAQLTLVSARAVRGGSFDLDVTMLSPWLRNANDTYAGRESDVGFRCARSP